MYRLSVLIGKEAIILSNGESAGTVSNVFFNVKLKILKFIELINDDEDIRKMVAFKGILSTEGEAIVIRSNANIIDAVYEKVIAVPMNLPCFNQDGKSLGTVRDVVMEGNKPIQYITDETDIDAGTLLVASGDLLIFNDTGGVVKKPPNKKVDGFRREYRSKQSRIKNSEVRTHDETYINDFAVDNTNNYKQNMATSLYEKIRIQNSKYRINDDEYYQSENETDSQPISTPEKIREDNTAVHRSPLKTNLGRNKYAFLIGLHLLKDIYNNNGQLILKKGSPITEKEIQTAKDHDRLVSMTLNCL